ncbi:zf-HC2 domain-containing protein [Streptomyces sp. NPDC001828]|uniref:zf-HC2 domain-containing protein n=1 Tax=Streptomyces sp. NPDC001828 TaxID=3364615 RepID=UPI003694FE67
MPSAPVVRHHWSRYFPPDASCLASFIDRPGAPGELQGALNRGRVPAVARRAGSVTRHEVLMHVRQLLGAYVLGALEPGEDRAVAAHLRRCAPCRAAYLEAAEASSLLALLTEADLKPTEENPSGPDAE